MNEHMIRGVALTVALLIDACESTELYSNYCFLIGDIGTEIGRLKPESQTGEVGSSNYAVSLGDNTLVDIKSAIRDVLLNQGSDNPNNPLLLVADTKNERFVVAVFSRT